MLPTIYLLITLTSYGPIQLPPYPTLNDDWDISTYHLARSGDCHPNPGTAYKFPCGVCAKPCRSNQHAVACDSCETWYHVTCMNMPLGIYRGITPNVSWICFKCGIPNFSTTLFDTPSLDSINSSIATKNTYSILSEDPISPPANTQQCHNVVMYGCPNVVTTLWPQPKTSKSFFYPKKE